MELLVFADRLQEAGRPFEEAVVRARAALAEREHPDHDAFLSYSRAFRAAYGRYVASPEYPGWAYLESGTAMDPHLDDFPDA